jgi:DNA-binding IclR family transcriptional regulator
MKASDRTEQAGATDRLFVIALARGLRVLQAYSPGDDLLTNAELARRTRLPRPTISRLTYTLAKLGYLASGPAGQGCRLEPHVLTLGFPVLARFDLRQVIRPLLQAIASEEGITAAIAMRDGAHMIFVDRIRAPAITAFQQDVGTRVPIATTAIGRAYLAGLAEAERAPLLAEIRAGGLPEWWPRIHAGIERELARYRARGYCFGGDWNPEMTGVGVPLALGDAPPASISCTGPRARLDDARLEAIGERLKAIVRGLEKLPAGEFRSEK